MPSIRVCGNLTLDEIVTKSGVSVSPGGSALFTSAAVAHLGSKVEVLGNVGEDYPGSNLKWLRTHGVTLGSLKKVRGRSARFRITRHNGSRRLYVLEKGSAIRLHKTLGLVEGTHLGPVFNEVSLSLAASLRGRSRFLSADLQGFIRRIGASGIVRIERKRLDRLVRMCDVVQASIEEASRQSASRDWKGLIRRFLDAGPQYCILTFAQKGSMLGVWPNNLYRIPAFPDRSVRDTTGAGDVFAGSWLATYLSTRDPVWAASVGSAFASIASRNEGLSKFNFRNREMVDRAGWVYDRVTPVSS